MLVDRDAAAVVDDGHARIGVDDDIDLGAGSRQRLVDRVIDHLVDEMVQRFDVRAAHVHAGPASDGFQSLQHLNAGCVIIVGLCH